MKVRINRVPEKLVGFLEIQKLIEQNQPVVQLQINLQAHHLLYYPWHLHELESLGHPAFE